MTTWKCKEFKRWNRWNSLSIVLFAVWKTLLKKNSSACNKQIYMEIERNFFQVYNYNNLTILVKITTKLYNQVLLIAYYMRKWVHTKLKLDWSDPLETALTRLWYISRFFISVRIFSPCSTVSTCFYIVLLAFLLNFKLFYVSFIAPFKLILAYFLKTCYIFLTY